MRTVCTASPRKNWPSLRVGRPSSSKSGPHIRSSVVIPLPVESLDGPFGLMQHFALVTLLWLEGDEGFLQLNRPVICSPARHPDGD